MISVVIPVKNGEKTIKDSIQSVLDQRIDDIEIICIINGTEDGSETEIKSFNNKKIKIFHSEPGIVPALNEGIRRSSGEIIARQDADDVWHLGKLAKQLDFLDKNKDIDIVGTQLKIVDKQNNFIRNSDYPLEHDAIVNSLLRGENPIGHPSVLFRKRILDKCSGYFDLFPLAEDLDLWVRAAAWYRFANIKETMVTYKHVPNPRYNPNVPKVLSSWYKTIYGVK